MNNNLEFENTDPNPNDFENNHPRTNYGEGFSKEETIQLVESNMDKYKLIKVTEGFLITCTEPITFSDTLKPCYYLFKGEVYKREYSHHTDSQKIIASNFLPELPSINFNNLEEEFGIINVEKLADAYIDKNNLNIPPNNLTDEQQNDLYPYEIVKFKKTYLDAFNKCLSLNKDKRYTLEDIKTAIRYGFDVGFCSNSNNKTKNTLLSEDEIIQSLEPKIEFEIELETEWIKDFPKGGFGGAGSIDIEQPKITNNSIKILRKNE